MEHTNKLRPVQCEGYINVVPITKVICPDKKQRQQEFFLDSKDKILMHRICNSHPLSLPKHVIRISSEWMKPWTSSMDET